MIRLCGIERKALREGEPGCKLRLAEGDVPGIEPGLYFCGQDAFDKYAPRVLERRKREPKISAEGKPVLDGEGQPVMTVPAGATLATIDLNLLI